MHVELCKLILRQEILVALIRIVRKEGGDTELWRCRAFPDFEPMNEHGFVEQSYRTMTNRLSLVFSEYRITGKKVGWRGAGQRTYERTKASELYGLSESSS